jgi:SAM-dependent methyltransferase
MKGGLATIARSIVTGGDWMTDVSYVLGHDEAELRRLEDQARTLGPATDAILRLAGIEPGMRVLDLGTGAGDVALAVARRVGPSGRVVGIERAADALALARHRLARAGIANAELVEGDLESIGLDGVFDAVVGRLVLLYLRDPVAAVRRFASRIRPGGVYVAMEYEMTAAGMLPPQPLAAQATSWVLAALGHTGHDVSLGARLSGVLTAAGLTDPVCLGMQGYVPADDRAGARMLAGIVATLGPVLEGAGIASADEIDIDSLEQRLYDGQHAAGAVFRTPTLVGAWARVR